MKIDDLKRKLERTKSLIQYPRMFVVEYYGKDRNNADIRAEKALKLIHFSQDHEVQKSLDRERVNVIRMGDLDFVNSFEMSCLEQLNDEKFQIEIYNQFKLVVDKYEKLFQDLKNNQPNLDPDMVEKECTNLNSLLDSSLSSVIFYGFKAPPPDK